MLQGYRSFTEKLDEIFDIYCDKTAIVYLRNAGDHTLFSFGDIRESILKAGCSFAAAGLVPGDRVALIAPHSPYAIQAGLALGYGNYTTVLIDTGLPAQEINRLLTNSDVRAVITTSAVYALLEKERLADIPVYDVFTIQDGYSVHSASASVVTREKTPDPDTEVIAILYSSGTTASMKGIMLAYYSIVESTRIYPINTGLTADMSYLLVLPFNHIAGYANAMQYLLTGCELGLIEEVDSSKLATALREYRPSFFAMVPKVYEVMEQKIRQEVHSRGEKTEKAFTRMLALSGFLRRHLGINIGRKLFKSVNDRVFGENIVGIGTGASPCPVATTEFFLNLGHEWANFYSSTETGVPTVNTGLLDRYPVGTEGNIHRYEGIEIRINDPDESGIGEITVKTKLIMKGYFREPELTRDAFDPDGFFKTGDLGYVDRKGYLHVTGRAKEAIMMHTGKKVAPTDIDSLYAGRFPDIKLAACGVPVENGSCDEIHLFVESEGLSVDEQKGIEREVRAFAAETGSLYQISQIHFIDKLPMTSVGKVKRFQLKELALAGLALRQVNIGQSKQPGGAREKKLDERRSAKDTIVTIASALTKGRVSPEEIAMETRFKEDLGFDSLTMLELCVETENQLNVVLADKLGSTFTVKDLLDASSGHEGTTNCNEIIGSIDNYPLPRSRAQRSFLRFYLNCAQKVWKYHVSGSENVPTDTNCIIASNHQSLADGLTILGAFKNNFDMDKICSFMAQEVLLLKQNSKIGLALARFQVGMLGGIPSDRWDNPAPAMKRCLSCLKNGYVALIHPEGTTPLDGKMIAFKPGVSKLSIDSSIPVVPVFVDGTASISPMPTEIVAFERTKQGFNIPVRPEFLRRRRLPFPRLFNWRKLRRYEITVRFGKPIFPQGKTVENLTAEIECAVRELGDLPIG